MVGIIACKIEQKVCATYFKTSAVKINGENVAFNHLYV